MEDAARHFCRRSLCAPHWADTQSIRGCERTKDYMRRTIGLSFVHLGWKNAVDNNKTSLYMENVQPSVVMRNHPSGFRVNAEEGLRGSSSETICID